jgi:hypothetical protein
MNNLPEKDLYKPVRDYLVNILGIEHTNAHLEITAKGHYSEALKHLVRHDIVFSFLAKAPPDLTGYILREGVEPRSARSSDVENFITAEIKPDKVTLQDIFQAKMYGDLFYARYALLISPEIIGEEIRRLQKKLCILNRFRDWRLYVGQVIIEGSGSSITANDTIWYPQTPF